MRRGVSWPAALLALATFLASGRASAGDEPAAVPSETRSIPATAVVVLIGAAGQSPELGAVLSELLGRQNVHPEIVYDEHFDPGTLLTEGEADTRVWVFVVESGEHRARLYFRGPLGKRFLLRELSLRNGLDEIGRELIAQVVETSTVALLRGAAGISRDEASATLAREKREPPGPPPKKKPPPVRREPGRPAHIEAAIGARGALSWNRSDHGPAAGVGAEGGLGFTLGKSVLLRGRLLFEYRAPQTIATPRLDASYGSVALRAAVDAGVFDGPHAVLLGVGAGADLDRVSTTARDPSLRLAPASDNAIAVVRAELRYELTVRDVWLAVSVLADFPAVHTHYDLAEPGGTVRLADLWMVRPGLSLTVGWSKAPVAR